MSDTVVTPFGRVFFEAVFEPWAGKNPKPGKKAKYTIALGFPPEADLSGLKRIAKEAADARWGATKPKKLRSPFITDYEHEHFPEGWVLIRPTSTRQPGIVDAKVQPILEPSDFYSGCWARATLHAFDWTSDEGAVGVSFGLNNVQKVKDDEPIGGKGGPRTAPEDDFEPVGESAGGKKPASSDDLFA